RPPRPPPSPYTPLFRSRRVRALRLRSKLRSKLLVSLPVLGRGRPRHRDDDVEPGKLLLERGSLLSGDPRRVESPTQRLRVCLQRDRKSTRLNSSHVKIS